MSGLRRAAERLRGERGFMLMDVAVSMSLLVVLFTGTLVAFNAWEKEHRANQVQNEAQDKTRVAIDTLARDLRNNWIEQADPFDLVAQQVNGALPATGNVRRRERVRYCLNTQSPEGGRLYRQVQTWTEPPTPAMAPTDQCPATGWNTTTVVVQHVTNREGATRPIFHYDTTVAEDVKEIRAELFVDAEPDRAPGESKLLSGVFLRNRNRAPDATFTWAATAGRPGYVLLNGSFSHDDDGDHLTYVWRDAGSEIPAAKLRGKGPLVEYGPVTSGQHLVSLLVRDPSGSESASVEQAVMVP